MAMLPFLLIQEQKGFDMGKYEEAQIKAASSAYGTPDYNPKKTKFKGYMREQRRTDRGHGAFKKKFN